jgi:NAD(P)-dependent dehydrogenase (short-subunit alcohol dehydrogenase family)
MSVSHVSHPFILILCISIPGIGLETARDLARRGARVILACRNMSKGIEAAQDIMKTTGNENLASFKMIFFA